MCALRLLRKNTNREIAEAYTPLVTIYADASCLRNGSPDASAGCGAVMIDRNRMELKLLAKYLGPVTNQQAEILACVKADEDEQAVLGAAGRRMLRPSHKLGMGERA